MNFPDLAERFAPLAPAPGVPSAPPCGRARVRLRRIHALILVAVMVVGTVANLDRLTSGGEPREPAAAAPSAGVAGEPPPAYHSGDRRLFIFLIDSLRYETAMDRNLMPYLNQMRQRATFAKTLNSHDPVTVPAIRAAFTGRDQLAILGFVRNFVLREEVLPSLFTQLKEEGLQIVAYSDGTFNQFGDAVPTRRSFRLGSGTLTEQENAAVRAALADFLADKHQMVVAHLAYTDDAAHAYHVGHPLYNAAFRGADAMLEMLDKSIPPEATLAVMGDHGHTLDGSHSLGLDVPTFSLYRGPGFATNVDLGTMAITEHRVLAGWALKVPLSPSYEGAVQVRAFRPLGSIASSYQGRAGLHPNSALGMAPRWQFGVLALYLGCLIALWLWVNVWPRAGSPRVTTALLWLVLVPLYFPSTAPWNLFVGVALAGLSLGLQWKNATRAMRLAAMLAPTSAVAFYLWGHFLTMVRPVVHYVKTDTLGCIWLTIAAIGMALARKRDAIQVWIWLIGPLLILMSPTVYSYGFASAMVPVWLCLMAFLMAQRSDGGPVPKAGRAFSSILLAWTIYWLLPFSFTFSTWFNNFYSWQSPIRKLQLEPGHYLMALTVLAKVILFVLPARLWSSRGLGLVMMTILWTRQFELITPGPVGDLLMILILGLGGLLFRRDSLFAQDARRAFRLGCLFMAYYAWIRVPEISYVWGDLLWAALLVTAVFVRERSSPASARHAHAVLLLIAVIIAGWTTLAWSFHRLEWHVLFDWLDKITAEKWALMLLPVMVLRYAVPVLIGRMLLAERLPSSSDDAAGIAFHVVCLKTLSIALVAAGVAAHSGGSTVYLDAVMNGTLLLVLCAGLL